MKDSDKNYITLPKYWIWLICGISLFLIIGAFIIGVTLGYNHNIRRTGGDVYNQVLQRMHESSQKNNSEHTPMNMSMNDMAGMLQGKTGDALDRAFLEGMIPHHQGAVDMAKYLVNAKHGELQKMGQDIIKAQTAEIEQMQKWMQEWGYTNTGTTQTGATLSGMMMHHHMPM